MRRLQNLFRDNFDQNDKTLWCQIVGFIMLVPNCPGAKLSVFTMLVPNGPFFILVPNSPFAFLVPNHPFLLYWCQIVRVPNCPVPNCSVPNYPGAKSTVF